MEAPTPPPLPLPMPAQAGSAAGPYQAVAAGTLAHRHYLTCPFGQKEECKALGGRWDPERKAWYVPPGLSLAPFLAKWGTRHDLTAQRVM